MKYSHRALSVLFGSGMLLLGPTEALAGGKGGHGGGPDPIRNVHACVDPLDLTLRVAFRVHGLGHYKHGIDVTANIFGAAMCQAVGCEEVCVPECNGQMGCVQCVEEPVCVNEIVAFEGIPTDTCFAKRRHANWFTAEIDLLPLGPGICDGMLGFGVDAAEVCIGGETFFFEHIPYCY